MKTALVTGANKGIGLEVAQQLAGRNYFVYLACRDQRRGEASLQLLRGKGLLQTDLVVIDVTDQNSIDKAFGTLQEKIPALDVLVNNAGILGSVPQDPSSMPLNDIRHVFETNFFGVIQVTQTFLPLLRKSATPRIVNVSSDLASLTKHQNPQWEHHRFRPAAYAPSKAAMNAYTVMLAKELDGTNFKVNAVNPGHTATDFNNYRGHKTAHDAAEVIVRYATIDDDGPTGKFFSDDGETAW